MKYREAIEMMKKTAAPMVVSNGYDRTLADASRQLNRGMQQMRTQLPQDPRFRMAMRQKNYATQAPTITRRMQQRAGLNRQLHPTLAGTATVNPAKVDQMTVAHMYPQQAAPVAPALPKGVLTEQQFIARGGNPAGYQRYLNAAMRSRGNTMVAGK